MSCCPLLGVANITIKFRPRNPRVIVAIEQQIPIDHVEEALDGPHLSYGIAPPLLLVRSWHTAETGDCALILAPTAAPAL